jgi:hypothetical protein
MLEPTAPRSSREPSFFEPVDETDREALYREYLRFLTDRNGEMDFECRRYSKREEHLRAMASSTVRHRESFDEDLFRRQYADYRPGEATPAFMKLLLVLCKMNAGEAFGIAVMRVARKAYFERPEAQYQAERVIANEEDYHTKILVGATRHFGIDLDVAFVPPLALKALIYGLANVPQRLFHSVLLAAELSGIYMLCTLLDVTRIVLRDQPELRDAVEERLITVLTDEIGHTSYNRLAVGSLGLGAARKLFPVVFQALPNPELKELRAHIERSIAFDEFDYRHVPEAARKNAFFV